MAESYSVKAILSAKDNGFTSTIKNAFRATESLASKIKGGFAFGVLSGIGQQAFSALTSGARDLVGEIDASNAAWKTFEGNMGMLGKSSSEIDSVKKELQEFAEASVYSSSDMAQTYAQLAAVGVKNTTKLVKGFGGLAAAAENPQQAMKTLSQQATQMAAKPNVAWADFKLMLEQTPAGIAAVAKEMGMTTSQLVTAVQKGTVKTDKFFDAITKVGTNKSFTKLATQYKTAGQAMDGLKETIGNKLTPAFDVLSQKAIEVISGISDKFGDIDATAIADKVGLAVDKVSNFVSDAISLGKAYYVEFKSAFDGVGKEVGEALRAVGEALGLTNGEFSKSQSVLRFGSIMKTVANIIKKASNFIEEHAETLVKVAPYVLGLVAAFKGFKIINSLVPGLGKFAGSLAKMAAGGIKGLAGKLFGISKGTDAAGKSSSGSSKKLLTSAKAFAMIGAGVLLVAAAFALLAQSAIALSNAGGLAVGVMAGLVIAVGGLMIGMMAMMNHVTASPAKIAKMSVAMLALGAAVLMIGIGFALLAQSAIALANAGGLAIGVMVGMVAVIALLAIGAAALGAALTAGAVGFLAFGAAIVLVGVGAVIAAAALAIVAAVLPSIVQYGAEGATAIAALGASMIVFAGGATLAGLAALTLGVGLAAAAIGIAACAVAVALLGAGVLVLGVGILVAAAALGLFTVQLPLIAQHGTAAATALLALGGALLVFSAGALAAGAACVVMGAGLVVVAAGLALVGAAVLITAAGVLALAAGCLVLGAGLTLCAAAVTLLAGVLPAAATGALLVVGAFAALLGVSAGLAAVLLVTNAPLVLIGVSALAASVAILAFGAAMLVGAAGTVAMSAALKGVKTQMKSIAKSAKTAENSLEDMRSTVKVVESGLDALGTKAKDAMQKVTSAFDKSASKAKSSGKKVADGFKNGLQSGLQQSPTVAQKATVAVATVLSAGRTAAYTAGAYISQGFAQGMYSQLGAIRSAAAQMAAAADAAIRAKAKIHSPSKVSGKLGRFFGEGYVNELYAMAKDAWKAAEALVSVPSVALPDLSLAYAGELSADYAYYRDYQTTVEVPLSVDGKEFARATATYTQAELDRKQARDSRKHGKV